jgi:flagellar protein FlgJ
MTPPATTTKAISPSSPRTALAVNSGPTELASGGINSPEELKAAAQKFEAIFIRQFLAAARATNFGGEEPLFGGPGLEQFNAMQDENLADIASQTGAFGFAKLIEAQLASRMGTES